MKTSFLAVFIAAFAATSSLAKEDWQNEADKAMSHCKSGNCWIAIADGKITIHDHTDNNKAIYDTDIDSDDEEDFEEWAEKAGKAKQQRDTSPNPPGRMVFARDSCTETSCPDGDALYCQHMGGNTCVYCYQTGTNSYTCSY